MVTLEARRILRNKEKTIRNKEKTIFCVQKIVLVGWGSKKAYKAEQG